MPKRPKPCGLVCVLEEMKNSSRNEILTGKNKSEGTWSWLSIDPKLTVTLNTLGCWSARRLRLIGKITVLKSLATCQVIHLLSSLQSNDQILKELNNLFFDFLWSGKGDKIKRHVIIRDLKNGGLKMIDIRSFNKALKCAWIKKYLDENNKGKWKCFFDYDLENFGGATFFRNLSMKDVKEISHPFNPFLKVVEIWAELSYEDEITSVDSFLSQSLWNNSLIRIMGKPVFKWEFPQ